MPSPEVLSADEKKLVDTYRKAKQEKFASIHVEIHKGDPTVLHWTHKEDLSELRRIKE